MEEWVKGEGGNTFESEDEELPLSPLSANFLFFRLTFRGAGTKPTSADRTVTNGAPSLSLSSSRSSPSSSSSEEVKLSALLICFVRKLTNYRDMCVLLASLDTLYPDRRMIGWLVDTKGGGRREKRTW